jgi:hypothetical protein
MKKTNREIFTLRIKLFRIIGITFLCISFLLAVFFIFLKETNVIPWYINQDTVFVIILSIFGIAYITTLFLRKNQNLLNLEDYNDEKKVVKTILKQLKNRHYPDAIKTYNESIKFNKNRKFLTPFILSELLNSRNIVYIGYAEEIISQYFESSGEFYLKSINL